MSENCDKRSEMVVKEPVKVLKCEPWPKKSEVKDVKRSNFLPIPNNVWPKKSIIIIITIIITNYIILLFC
jgi:hypothetical protein